ncbi:phospholipase A2 inhibitor NAI-like [Clarias gariepinus]|uniref:phospholipase A2 inhibitor NAI-like n=1 Tax=Clarias gariepinus TaxID=13013 RepID=UPI00234DEA5B|nr:phospholipase A2 inhibitor NAI-like [Clarias gariepinus]
MKRQFISILICLSFSKALALTCYDCYNDCSNPNQTTPCSDKCATYSDIIYEDDVVSRNRARICSKECYSTSLNVGFSKIAANIKCCDSDLCNNEPISDVDVRPNGKQCHFCAGENCLGILYCEGIEDRCFTQIGTTDGREIIYKGCVSESICLLVTKGLHFTNINPDTNVTMKCCEGNLCNSAESVTLSFILMLPFLLSTLLFH